MIEFACHQCKTRLKVKASAAGQTVACPRCQTSLTIPGDKPAPPAPIKPSIRHPLGDPPPGEAGDPAQRVVELTAQNRELQEKLRRKETELELARLKIADLAKSGSVEPKPALAPASPVLTPAVSSVEPPTPVAALPEPVRAGSSWGIRVSLVVLVAIIALLIGYSMRRSRSVPAPAPTEPSAVVPAEPTVSPPSSTTVDPSPVPPPSVAPIPVAPEPAPIRVREPEPPKSEPVEKTAETIPATPTNEPAAVALPVPPEPPKGSGDSP
jgi:hypothetical protein